ncbi:MAG TPA: NAD-dependent epimerase/dehydratase family protein [Spirochaetia bacterium]
MIAAVTGATGHVGTTLIRTLLGQGYTVRALVHHGAQGLDGLNVERTKTDIADPAGLIAAFRGVDVVFHTAARISITAGDADAVRAVNIEGTRNVLAACREAKVGRLVHFSSIEALEPYPLDSPVDEGRPFVTHRSGSPYAVSKATAESAVRAAIDEGLDAVVINPTAIIGPFDVRPSLLGQAVISIATGRIPALVDGGFDWVDVRDVAETAIRAAETAPAGARYIVGGRWASMKELAELVCDSAGGRPPTLMCPFFLAEAWAPIATGLARVAGRAPLFTTYTLRVLRGNRNVSHARAARELGYTPRDLRTTVEETCGWFRDRGLLSPAATPVSKSRAASEAR